MNQLKTEIEKRVTILVRPLKSEEQIIEILRKRLTKKEYKLLQLSSNKNELENSYIELNMDEEKYKKTDAVVTKKLNQEKLKQEICS